MKRAALALISTLMILPAALAAQTVLDKRAPAGPNQVVEIEVPAGSARIVGWEQNEVTLTGSMPSDAELTFETEGGMTSIEIDSEGHASRAVSDVEVHVPMGSHVRVEGVELTIEVSGVTGVVEAETVNGGISLSGAARELNLQSVNGSVDVRGAAGEIQVEVVNGSVTVEESSGEVEAGAVNGKLIVTGGPFSRAALESVAGEVRFDADLGPQGRLDIETVSGPVFVFVDPNIKADFSIETFSGEIENGLGVGTVQQERFVPAKELNFVTGTGGPEIKVETLSGSVHIRTR